MYGLIGKKLVHSFSADFFNAKFKNEKIEECYKLFPISDIAQFPALLRQYPELKGLNVTIPYKQTIIPFLDSLSEEATNIKAVNVIKFIRKGNEIKLKGYNSDCIGFKKSLVPLLHPKIEKALILGTGGASKAVAYVLSQLGLDYKFVSRNKTDGTWGYEDLNKNIIDNYLLIINTTPLGMFPDIETFPPIPYHFISKFHVCYDLVYNPQQTVFLKKALLHGAQVKNGLEMLITQAESSWEIWQK